MKRSVLMAVAALLCFAQDVVAGDSFILATGRRDPRIYAIDSTSR